MCFRLALVLACLMPLLACSESSVCERSGNIRRETSDLAGSDVAFRGCGDLCSTCGFGGGPANCVEQDDEAHCDCGGAVATICGGGTDAEDVCGETTCD